MSTIKQKVEAILQLSEKARNDDKYLILLYWSRVDLIRLKNNPNIVDDIIQNATSPSSIIRARTLVQSNGLYPPTEEMVLKRRSREESMRDSIARLGEVYEGE